MELDETVVPDAALGIDQPDLVAGRYAVGLLVGRGGGGQVHRAQDTFTDEPVALKFVRLEGRGVLAQLRRELTSLRLIDLPGIVKLRDDGEHDGSVFLVMDWLGGGRFDSLAALGWPGWRDAAITLLEAVGRLHFVGLIHGDLKPGNVMLDDAGRPVVTDFGLASGAVVVDHDSQWMAGTPRYMAPEQRRGEVLDARTDLYALGVMFAELGAPDDVMQVFLQMQAQAREDRPDSVEDVLAALGVEEALVGSFPGLSDPVEVVELRALFGEGPTFLHIAEDSAALVFERTDGSRQGVCRELARWIRGGRCYRDGEHLVMGRSAIEQTRWERRSVKPSLASAWASHRRGDTGRGLAILAALDDRSSAAADATVELALSLWSPPVVRAAAYQAERRGWVHAGLVLSAASALLSGNSEQALDRLGHPNQDPGRLLGWRLGVGISAAIRAGSVDAWLEAAARWAGEDAGRKSRLAAWRGRVAYVRGDFDEALAQERIALAGARVPVVRLSRLTTAASAALETNAMDEARAWAEEAREVARSLRHGAAEARAWWLVRTIALRSGQAPVPQPAWVQPALEVSTSAGALLALTEAALAWHRGLEPLAGELAAHAMKGFLGRVAQSDLARALAWRCGCADPPKALSGRDPEFDLQTWVLCNQAGVTLGAPPHVSDDRLVGRWLDVLPGAVCLAEVQRASKSAPDLSNT